MRKLQVALVQLIVDHDERVAIAGVLHSQALCSSALDDRSDLGAAHRVVQRKQRQEVQRHDCCKVLQPSVAGVVQTEHRNDQRRNDTDNEHVPAAGGDNDCDRAIRRRKHREQQRDLAGARHPDPGGKPEHHSDEAQRGGQRPSNPRQGGLAPPPRRRDDGCCTDQREDGRDHNPPTQPPAIDVGVEEPGAEQHEWENEHGCRSQIRQHGTQQF